MPTAEAAARHGAITARAHNTLPAKEVYNGCRFLVKKEILVCMALDPHSNEVRSSQTEPRLRGTDLVRPSLRDFAYLDNRRRVELIAEEAEKLPPQLRNLLDVGGRGKPYACFFAGRVANHYVLDVEPARSVDVVGDARVMPFCDASMDIVLITQVLEHIPEPIAVIGEIRRVLKPGGTLLLSVPGIFPQHGSPGDYWNVHAPGPAMGSCVIFTA